jgi:hypothetical protein
MLGDDEVAVVVRREGAAASGKPERKVTKVSPVLPQMMLADFDDGAQQTFLVLDGHVVTQKGNAVVARYLLLLDFPKKHALSRDGLISILETWGEVPRAAAPLNSYIPGPHEEEAALTYDAQGARLVVYGRAPSGPGGGFAGQPPLLRSELRIDQERHFKWRVDRWDGEAWQPHAL